MPAAVLRALDDPKSTTPATPLTSGGIASGGSRRNGGGSGGGAGGAQSGLRAVEPLRATALGGLPEAAALFYAGSLVLALRHVHARQASLRSAAGKHTAIAAAP